MCHYLWEPWKYGPILARSASASPRQARYTGRVGGSLLDCHSECEKIKGSPRGWSGQDFRSEVDAVSGHTTSGSLRECQVSSAAWGQAGPEFPESPRGAAGAVLGPGKYWLSGEWEWGGKPGGPPGWVWLAAMPVPSDRVGDPGYISWSIRKDVPGAESPRTKFKRHHFWLVDRETDLQE